MSDRGPRSDRASEAGLLPDTKEGRYEGHDTSTAAYFYVYAIAFDQDVFGCFATREEAEASLERQIVEGGPAWDGCKVERWRIEGTPEVEDDA